MKKAQGRGTEMKSFTFDLLPPRYDGRVEYKVFVYRFRLRLFCFLQIYRDLEFKRRQRSQASESESLEKDIEITEARQQKELALQAAVTAKNKVSLPMMEDAMYISLYTLFYKLVAPSRGFYFC